MLPVSSWLFWQRADGNNQLRRQNFRPRAFSNLSGPLSITFVRRGFQVVLARNFLFALFISVIPALMPVVGLKELHLSSSNLGLLFTSMGAGSVVGAVFIIPWLRVRCSPDCLTLLANLLLVCVYVSMALVRQPEAFFVVAALAGVGWTMSASELWVAAQRAIPGFLRARTREKHTAEPVQVRHTTYAFQILRPALLPPLLPADQARRTFNQAAKEHSENEVKQLLQKPSKQVQRQP